MKNLKRGFTLIELLVVIAIIGILSSVVLASLNSARNKGKDVAVKSNLSNIRSEASLFYDDTASTYTGLCSDTQVAGMVAEATRQSGAAATCSADVDEWVAYATLKDATVFCVDHKGFAGISASASGSTSGDIDCD